MYFRKTTKGQFARDDPAFLVLLALTFSILTVSFGVMNGLPILNMLYILLWMVCVDCLATGMLIASFFWAVGNKFLSAHPRSKVNNYFIAFFIVRYESENSSWKKILNIENYTLVGVGAPY